MTAHVAGRGGRIRLVRVRCPCCAASEASFERRVAGYKLVCGLVYVNPRPRLEDLSRIYQRKDAAAQADFYARTVSPAQLREYDRIAADLARLAPGNRLLDFGCAAGYFLQRAAAAGFEAYGIDSAPWVEEIAARRGVPGVRSTSLHGAAFPDASFDAVHASQVFEHLAEPLEELAEIRRILKPGGVLYVNVPNYRCLSIVLGRDDFELNTPPEHVTYFTPQTLARLLARGGFLVIRTASYGGVKWENLLGRPIKSEIAEAVRAGAGRAGSAGGSSAPPPAWRDAPRPGLAGRAIRAVLYRGLKVGMTLEAFARKT